MIQKVRLEKLIEYAKAKNLRFGVNEDEVCEVLKNLEKDERTLKYSNDDEIDMIVDKVCKYTSYEDLRIFLKDIDIQNRVCGLGMWAIASADSSHKVIAASSFLRKLEQLSNISSTIFMLDYYPQPELCDTYLQFIVSLVYAFDHNTDEDYDPLYHHAQYLMAEADKKLTNFSKYLIYFGREIYEYAVAFAVGHEIGHHYLGHVEELVTKKRLVVDSDIKKNELTADDFGAFFTIEYLNACLSEDNAFDFVTDEVFRRRDYRLFGVLVLFQLLAWLTGNKDSPTHPSAQVRLDNCLGVFKNCGVENKTVQDLGQDLNMLVKTINDTRTFLGRSEE